MYFKSGLHSRQHIRLYMHSIGSGIFMKNVTLWLAYVIDAVKSSANYVEQHSKKKLAELWIWYNVYADIYNLCALAKYKIKKPFHIWSRFTFKKPRRIKADLHSIYFYTCSCVIGKHTFNSFSCYGWLHLPRQVIYRVYVW